MKIKKGFVSQQIGDKTIVVSTGERGRGFHGMIELNHTGADIWNWLSEGLTQEETAEKFASKYDISVSKAKQDVSNMVEKMIASGVMEND